MGTESPATATAQEAGTTPVGKSPPSPDLKSMAAAVSEVMNPGEVKPIAERYPKFESVAWNVADNFANQGLAWDGCPIAGYQHKPIEEIASETVWGYADWRAVTADELAEIVGEANVCLAKMREKARLNRLAKFRCLYRTSIGGKG